MRHHLSCAFIFLLLTATTNAFGTDHVAPKTQPPLMAKANLNEKGELEIRQMVFVPVQTTETRKVTVTEFRTEIVGGKRVVKPVAVEKEVAIVVTTFAAQEQARLITKENFKAADLAGKQLEDAALAKAFKDEQLVLLTFDGKPLEPFYAAFFKPGTLVIQTTPGVTAIETAVPAISVPALRPFRAAPAIPAIPAPVPLPAPPPSPAPPKVIPAPAVP